MATDVVPPPYADHVHRIRTTVPCPPACDIGQLADICIKFPVAAVAAWITDEGKLYC